MAPRGPREPSIERNDEYNEFMDKLAEYHETRSTRLEREPRIGQHSVDLLRLYKAVTEQGGYDAVTKADLGWRKIGMSFHFGMTNLPALAFSVKSAYYKNLAAYEISAFHRKEPPPKEILEEVTARGGDLLNRTVENYQVRARDIAHQLNGQDSDGTGDEDQKTPKEDKMDIDEPGSTGRVTRGLRQAPPQRQLFQPDLTPARNVRHSSANLSSPQPTSKETVASNHAASSVSNSMSSLIASYEPKPQMPLTLRPVITPATYPVQFKERQKALREAAAARAGNGAPSYKGMMLPGTGFEGPNIYVRTLLALRSGMPDEQDYALHHLVKISHERGDKFKFDAFPGLAEGLIEKVLEVSSLFYDVEWEISYLDDPKRNENHILDGLNGTADILQRIDALTPLEICDDLETEKFSHKLTKVNEAGLVIRNMSMLEENAEYLSHMWPLRDFLCVALRLPEIPAVVELKHYALEIAEQLTGYLSLAADDALYVSLLNQLGSTDRGIVLTALRAISRISMNLEESNRLDRVPICAIRSINDLTLLAEDDEELVNACLDFLYQFTAVVDNVEFLLEQMQVGQIDLVSMINQLVRLLLHNAKKVEKIVMVKQPVREPAATHMPRVPRDLVEQLLKYEEPERSGHWLRCCFDEDAASEITQIALWQAYQTQFAEHTTPLRPLLPAAEFIKNVSTTFNGANAQVLQGPVQRFIIKGIRYRHAVTDLKGRRYLRCLWRNPDNHGCGNFILEREDMWNHIMVDHLRVPKNADGKFDTNQMDDRPRTCRWSTCRRYPASRPANHPTIAQHIKLHIPRSPKRNKHSTSPTPGQVEDAITQTFVYYNTQIDERGDAAGMPLTAALVLRNIARNVPKQLDNEEQGSMMRLLFGPVTQELWNVMSHNRPLATYMTALMSAISNGGG